MKKSISTLFFVLTVSFGFGQMNFFVRGSVQNTDIRVIATRTEQDKYEGKWGWFAGGQAEYLTSEKMILFGGAGLSSVRYEQVILHMADAGATNNYKLLFFEIPFGIGYQFQPGNKINLKLYLGGYYNIGVTGRNDQFWQSYYLASGPGYSEYRVTKKIKFGIDENFQDDFAKTNEGLQTSINLGFSDKLHIEFLYKHGISNILLKSEAAYENKRLRIFSLGLNYNFGSHEKEKRSREASFKKGF